VLTDDDISWARSVAFDRRKPWDPEAWPDDPEPALRARILSGGGFSREFLYGVRRTSPLDTVHFDDMPDDMAKWNGRRTALLQAIEDIERAMTRGWEYAPNRVRHRVMPAGDYGLGEDDWVWAQSIVRGASDAGIATESERWRLRMLLESDARACEPDRPEESADARTLATALCAMAADEALFLEREAHPITYPDPPDLVRADESWLKQLSDAGLYDVDDLGCPDGWLLTMVRKRFISNRPHTWDRKLLDVETAAIDDQGRRLWDLLYESFRERAVEAISQYPKEAGQNGDLPVDDTVWAYWVMDTAPDGPGGKIFAGSVWQKVVARARRIQPLTHQSLLTTIESLYTPFGPADWEQMEGIERPDQAGVRAVALSVFLGIEINPSWVEDEDRALIKHLGTLGLLD
jgi:hypothetical protein